MSRAPASERLMEAATRLQESANLLKASEDRIAELEAALSHNLNRVTLLERERAELVEALRMMLDGTDTLRYANARTLLDRLSASGKGAV